MLLTSDALYTKTITGRSYLDTLMGFGIGLCIVMTPPLLMFASFKFPTLENPSWAMIGLSQVTVLLAYFLLKNPQPMLARGFKFTLYLILATFVFGGIGAGIYIFFSSLIASGANH